MLQNNDRISHFNAHGIQTWSHAQTGTGGRELRRTGFRICLKGKNYERLKLRSWARKATTHERNSRRVFIL
jgi:hypothetical protein